MYYIHNPAENIDQLMLRKLLLVAKAYRDKVAAENSISSSVIATSFDLEEAFKRKPSKVFEGWRSSSQFGEWFMRFIGEYYRGAAVITSGA